MTLKQAFAALMQLFAVFGFFAIGFLCMSLPFFPAARFTIVQLLLEDAHFPIWVGLCFFSLTILFSLGFYAVGRGKLLLLRMGTEIDIKILKRSIAPLFKKEFASRVRLQNIEILKQKDLHFALSLSAMNEEEKEKALFDIELHLQTFLAERFGYRRPFTVQVRD